MENLNVIHGGGEGGGQGMNLITPSSNFVYIDADIFVRRNCPNKFANVSNQIL